MRKRERGKGTAPVQRIITEKDFRCARQTLPHSDTYAVWVMVNHFDELFTHSHITSFTYPSSLSLPKSSFELSLLSETNFAISSSFLYFSSFLSFFLPLKRDRAFSCFLLQEQPAAKKKRRERGMRGRERHAGNF